MKRILFICLGNICRSCTAQTIMQDIVDRNGKSADFFIDSAGIIDYHEGEKADRRMRQHAAAHGYNITHLSRPIKKEDFETFDLVIGMDNNNIKRLNSIATSNAEKDKIHRMTEWCTLFETDEVPDPYYGGDAGFERVINLLEDACQGLYDNLIQG